MKNKTYQAITRQTSIGRMTVEPKEVKPKKKIKFVATFELQKLQKIRLSGIFCNPLKKFLILFRSYKLITFWVISSFSIGEQKLNSFQQNYLNKNQNQIAEEKQKIHHDRSMSSVRSVSSQNN